MRYNVIRELRLLYNNPTREYVDLSKRKQIVKLHKPKIVIFCNVYRVSNQEEMRVKHAARQSGLRKCSDIRNFNQNLGTGLMKAVMHCGKEQ